MLSTALNMVNKLFCTFVANFQTSLSADLKKGSSSVLGKLKFPLSRVLDSEMFDLSLIKSSWRVCNSLLMKGFLSTGNSLPLFFSANVFFASLIRL